MEVVWHSISQSGGVSSYGTSGDWEYIKFNNGFAVCWQNKLVSNLAVTKSWSSHYYNTIPSINFPFTFADEPTLTAFISGSSNMFVMNAVTVGTNSTGQITMLSPASITESFYLMLTAVGKWK